MRYENTDRDIFQYEGRILKKNGVCYLGYTNSYLRFYAKGSRILAKLVSNITEEVNMAGLSVFLDDDRKPVNRLVIHQEEAWYELCVLPDDGVHLVTVIKVTEAAMSHVGVCAIEVEDGKVLENTFPAWPDLKLEFIGDSITCGYGVLGEPESAYTLREEDGLLSYGYVAAGLLGARARFLSASGYGVCVEYTGDAEGNVPKLYPYVNWFLDKEARFDFREYEPDVIVINLGTNDSGHMDKPEIQKKFVREYADFLRLLKKTYPDVRILCICGTLCDFMLPWIEKAVQICKAEGFVGLYVRGLPYHDVEADGMASFHPSRITHEKDGKRVAGFIREILAEEEEDEKSNNE